MIYVCCLYATVKDNFPFYVSFMDIKKSKSIRFLPMDALHPHYCRHKGDWSYRYLKDPRTQESQADQPRTNFTLSEMRRPSGEPPSSYSAEAMSPQALPAAGYSRASLTMDPETPGFVDLRSALIFLSQYGYNSLYGTIYGYKKICPDLQSDESISLKQLEL